MFVICFITDSQRLKDRSVYARIEGFTKELLNGITIYANPPSAHERAAQQCQDIVVFYENVMIRFYLLFTGVKLFSFSKSTIYCLSRVAIFLLVAIAMPNKSECLILLSTFP